MAVNHTLSDLMIEALQSTCFGTDDLESVLKRYFSSDFEEEVDGRVVSLDEMRQQFVRLRAQSAGGSIQTLASYQVGTDFAHHHRIRVDLAEGGHLEREVMMFGSLAQDGRLRRIVELSRTPEHIAR